MRRWVSGLCLLGLGAVLWLLSSVSGWAHGAGEPPRLAAGATPGSHVTYRNTPWIWRNPVPQGHSLSAIHFWPGGLGWAAGYGGTILHTQDGGATWTSQPTGVTVPIFDLTFIDDRTGWAVGRHGLLLHTTNGGANWTSLLPSSPNVDFVRVGFLNQQFGWILRQTGDILLTNDGGATWRLTEATGFSAATFVDAQVGWGVGSGGRIAKTTDGGVTWADQTSGTGDHLHAVTFVSHHEGWTVGTQGRILITTDGGATWIYQENRNTGGHSLFTVFAHDRWNAWLGGSNGMILRTTDGGVTWDGTTTGIQEAIRSLWFINAREGWAAGDSGTILRTSDGGANWQNLNTGTSRIGFTTVAFGDERTGYAAGMYFANQWPFTARDIVAKSADGGLTWTELPNRPFDWIHSLYYHDALNGWAASSTYSGQLSRTTDGGASWQEVFIPGGSGSTARVVFANRQVGWFVMTNRVYRTRDGGTTWTWVATDHVGGGDAPWQSGPLAVSGVAVVDEQTVWLAGYGQHAPLLVTRDGGDSWHWVELPAEIGRDASGQPIGLYGITFIDPQRGWAVGGTQTMLYTEDGGTTWQRGAVIPPPGQTFNPALDRVVFRDAQTGWAAHSYSKLLLATTDGGRTWTYQIAPEWTGSDGISRFSDLTVTPGGLPVLVGDGGLILSYGTPEAPPATPGTGSTVTSTGTAAPTQSPVSTGTAPSGATPTTTATVTAPAGTPSHGAYLPVAARSGPIGW